MPSLFSNISFYSSLHCDHGLPRLIQTLYGLGNRVLCGQNLVLSIRASNDDFSLYSDACSNTATLIYSRGSSNNYVQATKRTTLGRQQYSLSLTFSFSTFKLCNYFYSFERDTQFYCLPAILLQPFYQDFRYWFQRNFLSIFCNTGSNYYHLWWCKYVLYCRLLPATTFPIVSATLTK